MSAFSFLGATFGAKKSSGFAIIPFVIMKGFTITMTANNVHVQVVQNIPADMVSILDPTRQGFLSGNLMALSQMIGNPPGFVFQTAIKFQNVPAAIVIDLWSQQFQGIDYFVTLDILIFPANLGMLIQ